MEYSGFWHLPDVPNSTIYGSLKTTEEGVLKLDILTGKETFHLYRPEHSPDILPEIPVLHGFVRSNPDDKELQVTLFDCQMTHWKQQTLASFSMDCRYIITRSQFENKKEIQIKSMFFEIPFLNDWIGVHGFTNVDDLEDKMFSVGSKYRQPEEITLFRNSQFRCYVFFRAESNPEPFSHKIIQSAHYNIEFYKPLPFEKIDEFYN